MLPENPEIHQSAHHGLSAVFDWMPVCAIITDAHGFIQEVNQQTVTFFRASTKEDFIFDKQNLANLTIDSNRIKELLLSAGKTNNTTSKELFFRRFDKTISGATVNVRAIPDRPSLYLIIFQPTAPQNEVYIQELSQAFKKEAQKFRPYLNKPGKLMLDELLADDITSNLHGTKSSNRYSSVIIGEDRLEKISNLFPHLSDKELNLCALLSLKMSIDEIAAATGSTPNSLRVLLHRLLPKTQFTDSKEFVRFLDFNTRTNS